MSDSLQVTIKYSAIKCKRYPENQLPMSVVMHDLQLLRVHVPSRRNIRRQGNTVTLLWPLARKDPRIHNNSLYSRWVKISQNDLESVQLRQSLMIESITVVEGGQLAGKWDPQAQTSASSDGVPAAGHVPARQPLFKHVSIPKGPTYNTRKHSSTPFVVRLPSSRLTMGQQRTSEEPPTDRKRRLDEEDDPRAPRRQKLDNSAPTSPACDVGHSSSDGPHPALRAHSDPPPSPRPDDHSSERAARIASLTHEAWEIRKQRIHLRELEEAIRSEFCFLNEVPPLDPVDLPDKHDPVLELRLAEVEKQLRDERERRTRAERALEDVERECRSPFVVPALFRAFMTISELPT